MIKRILVTLLLSCAVASQSHGAQKVKTSTLPKTAKKGSKYIFKSSSKTKNNYKFDANGNPIDLSKKPVKKPAPAKKPSKTKSKQPG